MRIDTHIVIYTYLFVCTMLMLFNFIHIFRSKLQKRNMEKNKEKWFQEVLSQIQRININQDIDLHHQRKLSKRLLKTHVLISYSYALLAVKRVDSFALRSYLNAIYSHLQELALAYGSRDSMERAFFAYVIHRFPPFSGDEYRPLVSILMSYLENSTVYCRENVLAALCALGNIQAIENALQLFNDSGWFHHQKLISFGLDSFNGDKKALAARLWDAGISRKWNNNLMLAVVKFSATCSSDFRETFFPVLQAVDTDPEIRLAIIRYYRRHTYEHVRPVLLNYLINNSGANDAIAIVAASVLKHYPGNETEQALVWALAHPNWHVRNNAATSLIMMRVPITVLQKVLEGEDRFAKEILSYKLKQGAYL